MAAFSQAGLEYLNIAALTPAFKFAMDNITLDEIKTEKSGIEIHVLIAARTYGFNCDSCVNLEFDAGGGGGPQGDSGINIKVDDFSIRLHWRFDWHKSGVVPVSGAGKCESKIKVSKLETKVHVGAAGGKPAITPSGNVDVEIGDTDMGCDGLSGAAVNLVNDLFQDKIITALQAQAQQAIVLGIQAVGKALGGFSLDVPITDGFGTLRFDLTGQPNVTSDAAAMPLIADLVKANTTSSGTPYPPPRQLPPYDKSVGGYFQTYLSDYSFNTALYTYWKNGRLSRTVDPTKAPPQLKKILTTSALATVAPGIATKYPNMLVQLVVDLAPDTIQFVSVSAQEGVLAQLTLEICLNPITPSGAVIAITLSAPMQLNLGLGLKEIQGNLTITSNVSLSAPIQIGLKNSTVGTVDTKHASQMVNSVVSSELVPLLNKALQDGFPFPPIQPLRLKNSQLVVMDEFIRIETDFDWIAPPPPPPPPPPIDN